MRRRYSGRTADRMAGRLAWFNGACPRCDSPIINRVSQVVARKGTWIHTSCASGGDE